ncbi:MAG TPA: S41 family peptidase [Acidimicrobiales bacterium]|nr:S41 family peptidase [Acidimicrobiales bacterium]
MHRHRQRVAGAHRRGYGTDKKVFVLTSNQTFSAAEEFAYSLQVLKRATIVGETTGGGAHPGEGAALLGRHGMFVPSGRAINPITRRNWEGTGVVPDVEVNANLALETALSIASGTLAETGGGGRDGGEPCLREQRLVDETSLRHPPALLGAALVPKSAVPLAPTASTVR